MIALKIIATVLLGILGMTEIFVSLLIALYENDSIKVDIPITLSIQAILAFAIVVIWVS